MIIDRESCFVIIPARTEALCHTCQHSNIINAMATNRNTLETGTAGGRFDLFHEPQLSDPYPFFKLLRQHTPVFYAEDIDHWVVSRYEDVKQVLRDYENYSAHNTIMPIHPPV